MKRELAQILENKSQLGESLGRTRSSHPESARASLDVSENLQLGCSSSKRHKGSVVNGLIVYTRGRKARDNVVEAERAEKVKKSSVKPEPARPKSSEAEEFEESELVEVLVKEESNGTLVIKDEKAADKKRRRMEGGAVEVPVLMAGSIGQEKSLAQVGSRRFTRSTLKPKVEQKDEERALESEMTVFETKLESNSVELGSPSSTPNNKLELKMSKKITLNKKPTTVKELFDTGLVDGVPVVYMGGKKTYGLRGTIRDGGIVCSCPVCKGCNVVPPSQFEIHACKQYKRAAQYICLENGRSLLDLLKACRGVPLHTLESTVQSFLNSSPDATYFTCKNCKVSFPPSCVEKDASLCNSCLELQNPQLRPTEDVQDKRLRSSTPVHVSSPQSPNTAPTLISSQNRNDSELTRKRSSTALLSMKTSKSATPKRAYKKRQKTAAKSKTSFSSSLSPKSAYAIVTPQNKSASKIKSASAIASPQNKSASKIKSAPQNKSASKIKNAMKNKSASATIAAAISSPKKGPSAMTSPSPLKRNQWKITTKDIRLHKLVFEDGGLPDGSEVAYYARGKKLLEGYKKGVGIFCRCCNCEVSPSQFEAHAGWASRRKPYAYIYTSNGVSLHELAVSLSKGRKYSAKDNDDLCIICADGGNLLLCDGCPRAFHRECASIPAIPRGDWYCQYCQNMFQREKFLEYNANALAAGRISGVDSIEQITQRCIRIVKNIEAELSGCVLCRCHDFSKSGFGPRTIILCDQCEKEYHVGCLKKNKMANLKELPRGKWFCCPDCDNIHSTLQKLLVSGAEKIPESLLNTMKKKHEERGLDISMGFDVSWRLINGKIASPDSRVMLSKAVAIFHECFDPIVDFQSGRDLIPAMVYGRNVRGQEFGGMYCAILTVNSTVVSAGIIRVFGQEIAELPLVATSNSDHGKGYFQLLFSCIQKLLSHMNVKSLVLPAAEEAEAIWTEKFGFTKIAPDQLINYRKTCYQMVTFQGTSMLQKKVPENLVNPVPLSEQNVPEIQVNPAPSLEQNVPEIQVNPVPSLEQNVPEIQVNPGPSLEQNVPEILVNPSPSLEQNVRGIQVNPAPSLEQNVREIQVNPMPSLEKNVTESLVNSMSSLETNVTERQVHPGPSSEKNAPESPVNPTAALETDVRESQVNLVSSSENNNPEFQVNPVQL